MVAAEREGTPFADALTYALAGLSTREWWSLDAAIMASRPGYVRGRAGLVREPANCTTNSPVGCVSPRSSNNSPSSFQNSVGPSGSASSLTR
jgi:hypothetical protein